MSFLRLLPTAGARRFAPSAAARLPAPLLRTHALAYKQGSGIQPQQGWMQQGVRSTNVRAGVRCLSLSSPPSSSVGSVSVSSSASAPASSGVSAGDVEIKIMAHYIGAHAFEAMQLPPQLKERALRFTQPDSIIIPLEGMEGGAAASASASASPSAASSSPLPLSTFFSLPPIPVQPIVRIPAASSTPASQSGALPSGALGFDPTKPFLVAYQYGAVVFFNLTETQQNDLLPKQSPKDTAKLKDDYKIVLSGAGEASRDPFSCDFLIDSVKVSSMDLNSVRIISQILSQAVAMQHYEGEATRLLIKLRQLMRPEEMKKGVATFSSDQRSDVIVRYVAESTVSAVEVLTEIKLLDRSEIVWGRGEYEPLWAGLRREFDLSDRFDNLQTKLNLLRDSHPFFLQVIHQIQAHRMEIIIILLIAIEVVLGLHDLAHRYLL